VKRWQPIVSFSVVLLLLLGLFAITIDRASSPGGIPSTSDTAPLSAALQSEGQAIVVEPDCTAREVVWHEPESTLAPDRPARYVPIGFASKEIGQQALATYLSFKACEREILYPDADLDEDYLESWVGVTYLTDRAVQDFDDHGVYLTASDAVSLEITQSAPIPVNRPIPTYLFKGSRDSIEGFNAGDVFKFFDGRYGAIIGSVSTSAFREGGDPGTWEDGLLTFVAFVEQDGQLFIDEYQTFCTGEWKSEEGYVWFEGTPTTSDQDAMLVCR
jgi:hypothetical protein